MTDFYYMSPSNPPGLIIAPHANDVLLGRGIVRNNHPGNKNLRDLVDLNKELYLSSNKRERASIARSIVLAVRSMTPPGRFLTEDATTSYFYDVGDTKAAEKTTQIFRDRKDIPVDAGTEDTLPAEGAFNVVTDNDGPKYSSRNANPDETAEIKQGVNRLVCQSGEAQTNDTAVERPGIALIRSSPITVVRTNHQMHPIGPFWTPQPSPAKKRKLKAFKRSTIMHDHAFASPRRHMVVPIGHVSVGAMAFPSSHSMQMSPWQLPHPSQLPFGGGFHYGSDTSLAHMSVMAEQQAVPYQFMPQMPIPPSMSANISYVPTIQYQPAAGIAHLAAQYQSGYSYHHGGGGSNPAHISHEAFADETESDTDDEDTDGEIFQRLKRPQRAETTQSIPTAFVTPIRLNHQTQDLALGQRLGVDHGYALSYGMEQQDHLLFSSPAYDSAWNAGGPFADSPLAVDIANNPNVLHNSFTAEDDAVNLFDQYMTEFTTDTFDSADK